MQHQKKLLNEIQDRPTFNPNRDFPITPDNNIVFVNHDAIIRRPREFKTPPPPMYGEESEYEMDPREKFYDVVHDPNAKKFNFLDSRQGSVSNHYHKYINSKTMKKRNKHKKLRKHKDSLSDSEQYDTIAELPGLEIQQHKKPLYHNPSTYREPHSNRKHRALSLSPSTMNNFYKAENSRMHNDLNAGGMHSYERNSTFKQNAPNIISKANYVPQPVQVSHQPVIKPSSSAVRPIRSGAFQRINSVRKFMKS